MVNPRPAPVIACAALLAAALACGVICPLPACGGEPEVIRGTVDKFRPGALSLFDVTFGDGNAAGTPIVVIVNDNTEFFDGPIRTTRESVEPGVRVLVRCKGAGPGWLAVLVRIVGGKHP